jgi:hypothetical protein
MTPKGTGQRIKAYQLLVQSVELMLVLDDAKFPSASSIASPVTPQGTKRNADRAVSPALTPSPKRPLLGSSVTPSSNITPSSGSRSRKSTFRRARPPTMRLIYFLTQNDDRVSHVHYIYGACDPRLISQGNHYSIHL